MIAGFARRLPFFYGWVVVGVAFVTMALGVNARTAYSLFYPAILAEFGWDQAVTAGAFSFGFMVSAFLGPLIGRLMDRRGAVWVMELGALAVAGGLLLATQATRPWHVYATLGVLVGSGSVALGYSGQALYLPNWFLRRRGLAISLAYAGVGAGSIAVLPLVQAVIDASGWRAACLALGLAVVLVVMPLNLLVRRRPEELGLTPDGETAAQAAVRRSVHVVDAAWAATDWTLARALGTARFWWLAAANFAAMFAWYAVQVHQTHYLIAVGFPATTAAWALGAVSLAGIPGQIALGILSDRIGREPVWAIGCAGFLLTYLLLMALAGGADARLLWLMIAVQGLLGYGITSVFSAVAAELFEGRQFGTIFGTLMLGAMTGGAAGPFALGVLHDATGSHGAGFAIGAGMSLASIAAVWLAAPRKVRRVGRAVSRRG